MGYHRKILIIYNHIIKSQKEKESMLVNILSLHNLLLKLRYKNKQEKENQKK